MFRTSMQVGAYGVITLLGGLDGYLSKGSVPSLAAGTALGVLLLAGARGLHRDRPWGWWLCTLCALALVGRFAPAFTTGGRLYPHGMMAALGVWVLGVLLVHAVNHPPAPLNREKGA